MSACLRLAASLAAVLALSGAAAPKTMTTPDGLVVTKVVSPVYPKKLQKRGIEGCVVLVFEVQPDGRAANIEVLDSVPAGRFDNASTNALKEWRFEVPARKGRYAQAIDYKVDPKRSGTIKITPAERHCMAAPSFDALNTVKRNLKLLSQVAPSYAPDPGAPEGGGCVTLDLEVRPSGKVGEVTVLDAAPGGRYVQAAIDAVKQWRFEPFDPPTVHARQTFTFDPEQIRLPDNAIRPAYATATSEGGVANNPCSVANAVKAKS